MGVQVVNGAQMLCSFGTAPASLIVVPVGIMAANLPVATIMDYIPNTNIPPFAMCTSMANPAVASATSAASGVLTPQACTPMTAAPWAPGAVKVKIMGKPALTESSKCMCSYGGTISITSPGQTKVMVT